MSTIITKIHSTIFFELTEGEAGALDAICGYGPQKFLEWFKKNHGSHYIEKYETHVKTLFEKARKLDIAIKQLQDAKKQLQTINC